MGKLKYLCARIDSCSVMAVDKAPNKNEPTNFYMCKLATGDSSDQQSDSYLI